MNAGVKKRVPNEPGKLSYFLLHKPYGVICQFSGGDGKKTLAAFGPFPKDVYAAGRLDTDSEGLLLLTNDGALQHLLLEPKYRHPRTYIVQVERIPAPEALEQLRTGVVIEGKRTLAAEAVLLAEEPEVGPRPVPVRFRKNVPTSWLRLTLREGRNRQVRKMTAAVGHPALRLIRTHIGPLSIDGLALGESRVLTAAEIGALKRALRR